MNNFRVFLETIISIIKIASIIIWKRRLPGKNTQKGEINILATGPSLIRELSNPKERNPLGKVCMVVNDFALSEYYEVVAPKYYCFADDAYWLDEKRTNSYDVYNRNKVLSTIIKKTTWDMCVILPNAAMKSEMWKNINKKNSRLTIWTYNESSISDCNQRIYFYCLKYNLVTPSANVLALGIYSSIYWGFKKINLYGIDHSWTEDLSVNSKNQVCLINRHLYEKSEEMRPWLKSDKTPFTMSEILTSLSRMFHQYDVLRKYANVNDTIIVNHTKHSFIDAFDRY